MCADEAVRVCPTHNLVLEERRGDELVCPGPRRHRVTRWNVVTPRTGRSIYEADKEGTRRIMNEKATVAETPEKKSLTLEHAKFIEGTGLVLFIHLRKKRLVQGGDPFRICWQQGPGGGKKGTVGGVAKTCPDEASARAAFKAHVRDAIEEGWSPVPIGRSARKLEMKPVPAPKKRAA